MEVHPQILIFAGSLVAILALAGLSAFLKLGGTARLESASDAVRIAQEVVDGFEPVEVAIDSEGAAALLCDDAGNVMLLKRHGNKFAGRLIASNASARVEDDTLIVASGERLYGQVALRIDDPDAWAHRIDRL